ncbi:hypothetical protein [Bacillus phage BC-T25]|nr:hypothetical protein [Bacillus phage BC-T25]
MVILICTLLYLAVGIYLTLDFMKQLNEQLDLYNEEKFKEIDDAIWESVKEIAKVKEMMGDKAFKYVMYPIMFVCMPVIAVWSAASKLKDRITDYWKKGRFQKIKNGTKVLILEEGRYEDTNHYFKEGYVEGFLPAHMTPHKTDIYLIGFEEDDIDTNYAYEPDKFRVLS